MRVILVYDLAVERIDAVRLTVKQYLNWVQNSVFEGDLSGADLAELMSKISAIIDRDSDSVLVYSIGNPKWIKKDVIGVDRNDADNII